MIVRCLSLQELEEMKLCNPKFGLHSTTMFSVSSDAGDASSMSAAGDKKRITELEDQVSVRSVVENVVLASSLSISIVTQFVDPLVERQTTLFEGEQYSSRASGQYVAARSQHLQKGEC